MPKNLGGQGYPKAKGDKGTHKLGGTRLRNCRLLLPIATFSGYCSFLLPMPYSYCQGYTANGPGIGANVGAYLQRIGAYPKG